MKSFLIALALCASCCLSAEEVIPQPVQNQEIQAVPAAEPQAVACPCCGCEDEETTECACGGYGHYEKFACSRCRKSVSNVLAGCGCKNKGKVLVNQQETQAPLVEETEALTEEQVA